MGVRGSSSRLSNHSHLFDLPQFLLQIQTRTLLLTLMKKLLVIAALTATPSTLLAQSPLVGIDLRGTDHVWTSDTGDFVGNWVAGPNTTGQVLYAIDYDATATTLYAINYNTSEYGSFDIATGAFTTLGTTNLPLSTARGLTAHPNGTDWYVVADAGSDNELWVGDITTGTFTSVGVFGFASAMIDIACDSNGNLFTHSITDDSLYSVDPLTAAETLVGPIGADINFAQGMDFDWSDDSLYATLYTGTGTGQFVTLDTTTGAILTSVATDTLNAEMEIAVMVPAGADPGIGTPFCDPNNSNSTGGPATMVGTFGSGVGSDLHLEITGGPVGQLTYVLVGNEATAGIPISNGQFCLVGTPTAQFFRYNVAGTDMNSIGGFDATGTMINAVGTSTTGFGYDVPSTIPDTVPLAIMAGDTWHFQGWYRDTAAGVGSSNFTNGLSVTF